MTTEDLQIELKRVLPTGHPFVEQFEKHVGLIDDMHAEKEAADEIEDIPVKYEYMLNRLIGTLEDWRRGIRDWDEVESELIDARNQEWT